MKKIQYIAKNIVKITALALVQGILFFSCAFNGLDNNGTLLITLPGTVSGGRAVSDEFTNTLNYHIACTGSDEIIREAGPGAIVSISLSPGDWSITVTVNNSAKEEIGNGTKTAVIESGRTTNLQIPISIDTSRSEIKSFAITEPVGAEGVIDNENNEITVTVDAETEKTKMKFTVIHTGKSISLSTGITSSGSPVSEELLNPDEPLDFSQPQEFVVTAENGEDKTTYTVFVITEGVIEEETEEETDGGETGVIVEWPTERWGYYNLSGLTQPKGTYVHSVSPVNYNYIKVILGNGDSIAYESLLEQIKSMKFSNGRFPADPDPAEGRSETFVDTAGNSVYLKLNTSEQTITIEAGRSGFRYDSQ